MSRLLHACRAVCPFPAPQRRTVSSTSVVTAARVQEFWRWGMHARPRGHEETRTIGSSGLAHSRAQDVRKREISSGMVPGKVDDDGGNEKEQSKRGAVDPAKSAKRATVDVPTVDGSSGGVRSALDGRLPNWLIKWNDEFRPERHSASENRRQLWRSGDRIIRLAMGRVFTPQANKIVLLSGTTVLCLGAAEAAILCRLPLLESWEFAANYAAAQLLPSIVWGTADANLVASAMGLNPDEILRQLEPSVRPEDATAALRLQALAAGRAVVAGFMLIAQIVRGFYVSTNAAKDFEDRIRNGDEIPLGGVKERVFRLNGVQSGVTEVSLHRYGEHIFPVFEDSAAVAHLVRLYSRSGKVPVFWRVHSQFYGNRLSWFRLPADADALLRTSTGKNILYLEADTTNADDPLALGVDRSLDLTIDDASQGFREIEALFRSESLPVFRTRKVLLANSLEEAQSGGGYSYTLRHRVRYAKEADVLIDSRAPVIADVLKWCNRVAGDKRMILVQTKSRKYFLSLQLLLRRYGFDVFDPLDWHLLQSHQGVPMDENGDYQEPKKSEEHRETFKSLRSLLSVLLDEMNTSSDEENNRNPKRMSLVEFSKLPRLVYYETTAETVNAVQALVNAGEVDVANCCALLDREEGMRSLVESLMERRPNLMEQRIEGKRKRDLESELANIEYEEVASVGNKETRSKNAKRKRYINKKLSALEKNKEDPPSNPALGAGLHIICSAVVYDDIFRQVRQWTRMGFSAQDIQKELDLRYHHIIKDSGEVSIKAALEIDEHEAIALEQSIGPAYAAEDGPSKDVTIFDVMSDETDPERVMNLHNGATDDDTK